MPLLHFESAGVVLRVRQFHKVKVNNYFSSLWRCREAKKLLTEKIKNNNIKFGSFTVHIFIISPSQITC